jgi:hypothetical protein
MSDPNLNALFNQIQLDHQVVEKLSSVPEHLVPGTEAYADYVANFGVLVSDLDEKAKAYRKAVKAASPLVRNDHLLALITAYGREFAASWHPDLVTMPAKDETTGAFHLKVEASDEVLAQMVAASSWRTVDGQEVVN